MSVKFEPKPAERVVDSIPSIWNEFSALAISNDAVNLGQGFPDGPAPKFVTEHLRQIAKKPEEPVAHQYTRGYGHPELVNVLAKWYTSFYKTDVNPMHDILITVGAYHALYYAFLGWLNEGDEAIIIEPAFDCYAPQIKFAGGVPVPVSMTLPEGATHASEYSINFEEMEQKATDKTKILVINNPNNPTGKLFTMIELKKLAEFAKRHNLIVIADEVYEFHVYNPSQMIRFASLPGMYERTISIGSAGKVFSVTGWKLGWAIAPETLLSPLKEIHQNCTFACSTPTQLAVARAFETEWVKVLTKPRESYLATILPEELLKKRNEMEKMLTKGGFLPIIPDAGYFMLASFSRIPTGIDYEVHDETPADIVFSKWLCTEKKLVVIPVSVFFSAKEEKQANAGHIRVCFFKKDQTLNRAKSILRKLHQNP